MRSLAVLIALALAVPFLPVAAGAAVEDERDIAGRVWRDLNVNGLRDRGEEGVPGIPVLLFAGPDVQTELDETVTDSNGEYGFADVADGEYEVRFRLPDQLAFTYQDVGDDDQRDSDADRNTGRTDPLAVVEGQPVTLDAGVLLVPELSLIGGGVWEDWDDDGIVEFPDEVPLSGITVNLLRESRSERRRRGGGRRGGGADQVSLEKVATVLTDGFGGYAFYVVPNDDVYRVEVEPPSWYETVLRDQGPDDVDSDVDPVSRRSDSLDALADHAIDIGLTPLAGIADWAWVDANGDGLQGEDEEGLPGVLVYLYRFDEGFGHFVFIDVKVTDEDGFYAFAPRRPGTYRLRFLPVEGYAYTLFRVGDERDVDSDAIAGTGETPDIHLPEDAVPPFVVGVPARIAGRGAILAAPAGHVRGGRPLLPGGPQSVGGGAMLGAADVGDDAIPGGAKPAGLGPWSTEIWDAGFVRDEGRVQFYGFDVEGGPIMCGGTTRARDREVTIERVASWRLPDGSYVVLVRMARGLTSDYSFAVLLNIRTPDGVLAFLWEIHDGQLRIGQVDNDTGEVIRSTSDELRIEHLRDMGLVGFELPPDAIGEDADLAIVRSFHTPKAGQVTRCHMSPTFDLPH
jgi:hypothetical protein